MVILVTGGAGYIGSICVEEFLNYGYNIIVYDNLSEGNIESVDSRAKFILAESNNNDIDEVIKLEKPDIIVHFAANAIVSESISNPIKYFNNNLCNGIKILNAAIKYKVKKFIFSSTCATYGIPYEIPIKENSPQNPINPYGESKLIFEKIIQWYNKIYGLDFIGFRYFNAAGASEKFGEHHRIETHLIPNILKVALNQKKYIEIYGNDYNTKDGTCIRDFVHVKDLAKAHILGIQSNKTGFYNLSIETGYSVKEVIDICEKITKKEIKIINRHRRFGDPSILIANADKVRKELNWNPEFTKLEEIIQTAWKWHKKYPNGYIK